METETLPAAIYARISRDAGGERLGVDRQEADCRALAKRLGWSVAAVFVDNDISAYGERQRPQYRAMLDAIRAGQVRGVVAWHNDRLHRRPVELEEFIDIAEKHDLQVQTVTSGDVNLGTPSGRMVARMLGAAARGEVDHARERMRRAKEQMAEQGKYRGGPRPYGYHKGGVRVREAEAQVIREATKSVLAGRSLRSVADELNARGLRTSTGKEWTYSRLRDVLIRPRNAGLLSKGRADRGEAEIVGPAVWPAILDEETWRAVYDLLTDPARRTQDGNRLRWLGSGIYRCGRDGCGAPMRAAPFGGTPSRGGERQYHYRCTARAHLTIAADRTDKFVREVVAELVRDPRVVAAMQPQGDDGRLAVDRERRLVLVARMEGFENDYAAGLISGSQLQRVTASVERELAQVDARLTEGLRRSTASPVLEAADPGRAFLDAPLDIQRAVIAAVVRVTVQPQARRGAAWSSDRIDLKPVTQDD